jgi:hypothetical protein
MTREKAMLKRNYVLVSLLLTCLLALGAHAVQAAPVGNFLQVEGTVDLLKGGKVPAIPAKVQEGVAVGDMVRTKSESRAQIKFVDDTVLTIAPESGITIEEYMFDAAKNDRKAVVGVLRGMVQTAVEKVSPKTEPDFIMKTHTAVLGVRGTRWYTKLLPNATDIYTEEAKLEVRNILPEIPGVQILGNFQYCRVGMYLAPTVPIDITKENLKLLEKQMKTGIGAGLSDTGPGPLAGPNWPPLSPKYLGERSQVEYLGSGFYVPPRIATPPAIPHVVETVTPPPVQQPPSSPTGTGSTFPSDSFSTGS